ncbi:MAG: amidohydrolase family protein, partial [Planctomycetes bacterium]|nr:amidohydrolase family protein [Planctomycetota bacterium]
MRQTRRMWLIPVTAMALGIAGPTHPTALADFQIPTAITNVTIHTGSGEVIESGTILLSDGRITEVGRDVEVPSHAEVLDGTGLTAYPGWIDAHTHLGIPEEKRPSEERERAEDVRPDPVQGPLAATRFANRRGIRPQLRALEQYAPKAESLEAYRAAGFTTALVAPRDGLFGGRSDLLNLSDQPIRRCVLASDVAQHASYDPGEEGQYPKSLLGIFAQFRQVLLDARWHAKLKEYEQRHPTTSKRAPTDATLDALQRLLGRRQPIVFEANTENEIRRALALAREFHLDITISGAKEAWKVLDRIKSEHVPLIVGIKFDPEPDYGKKKKNGKKKASSKVGVEGADDTSASSTEPSTSTRPQADPPEGETKEEKPVEKKEKEKEKIYEPLKVRKERRRLWEEQVANLVRLHEAGVPFALRTRDFEKPEKFWKNLRMVVKRGLPEEAVLAALTRTPAAMFGLKDQIGTIERGRVANLTLTSGPLLDKKSKVRFVFIDGRKFEIEHDDKDKDDKKSDDGKDSSAEADEDVPDEDRAASAEASESKSEEPKVEDEEKVSEAPEEIGPTWTTEIKADRKPKTRTGGNVLIRNATLIPVSSPTLARGSILIRNGRIEAIGSDIAAPEGVTVIDATGRFVIPGFVDCHSHLGIDAGNESALAISAEVRIADVLNPHHVGIYRAVAGGTTTHHVMHGSANPIGGQNVILKLKYGRPVSEMFIADAPPTIKFALGENVTQANSQRARGKRFPNTRMGVEAVIRTALEAARTYQLQWDRYERRSRAGEDLSPPRRDLRLEALANVLAGKLTVHSHCYRSDEILRLLAVAEDFGFRIGTLQHVLEGYRIAPEIARHGSGASTFSNFWAYKVEAFGAIPHNAALMTEHGINVSVNSDSANTIRYLGQEAAKCIRWGGLDENQALRLVTLNPAIQLQVDDRVGSLEVGKDGDVAIFNGHPLNTFSKCIMTLIEGEVYFEDPRPEPTEPADRLVLPGVVDRTIVETPHRAYAIVGATVHTIFGPVIENGTVVILEDRIHEVGVNITVPPGAGVIDGKGLHVYPGLIDAGGMLGLTEIGSLRSTRDYRDIARFSPHLHASSAIHSHSEHIRIARTSGTTTALTFPSGGIISGQSAVIHLEGWTADEMIVVRDFALHLSVPSLPARLPDDAKKKKERIKKHKKAEKELNEFMAKAQHYAKVKKLAAGNPEIRD